MLYGTPDREVLRPIIVIERTKKMAYRAYRACFRVFKNGGRAIFVEGAESCLPVDEDMLSSVQDGRSMYSRDLGYERRRSSVVFGIEEILDFQGSFYAVAGGETR